MHRGRSSWDRPARWMRRQVSRSLRRSSMRTRFTGLSSVRMETLSRRPRMIIGRTWDAVTGNPHFPLRAGDEVPMAIFNPAGSSLLVVSKDGSARIWDTPPRETPPSWASDLAEFASTQVGYDVLRVRRNGAGDETASRDTTGDFEIPGPVGKFGAGIFRKAMCAPSRPGAPSA